MSNPITTQPVPTSAFEDKPPSYDEVVRQQPTSTKEDPIQEPTIEENEREAEKRRREHCCDCCDECTNDTFFWYLSGRFIADCCICCCRGLENCLDSFYDGCGNCCNTCFCGCCQDDQGGGAGGNAGANVAVRSGMVATSAVLESGNDDGEIAVTGISVIGAIGNDGDVITVCSGGSDIGSLSVSDCGCFD